MDLGVPEERALPCVLGRIACLVGARHGTGSHFVTQRPSDPGIQRLGDPVDPVTVLYNKKMSTYVLGCDKSKSSLLGLTPSDFSPATDA